MLSASRVRPGMAGWVMVYVPGGSVNEYDPSAAVCVVASEWSRAVGVRPVQVDRGRPEWPCRRRRTRRSGCCRGRRSPDTLAATNSPKSFCSESPPGGSVTGMVSAGVPAATGTPLLLFDAVGRARRVGRLDDGVLARLQGVARRVVIDHLDLSGIWSNAPWPGGCPAPYTVHAGRAGFRHRRLARADEGRQVAGRRVEGDRTHAAGRPSPRSRRASRPLPGWTVADSLA